MHLHFRRTTALTASGQEERSFTLTADMRPEATEGALSTPVQ